MPRPKADRNARRAQFADIAAGVFAERGVANTSVSDIVSAAGVAQGTFYIYFESKDDIVMAVVERFVDRMVAALETEIGNGRTGAVDKLLGVRDVFAGFTADRGAMELSDLLHRPENRALHDRLTQRFIPCLAPLVESIVRQGVEEGVFDVEDPRAAAWFVLGGFQTAEASGASAKEMPDALASVTELALRTLGHGRASS